MTEIEIARKLEMIPRLTRGELDGWKLARLIDNRDLFDGEAAALVERARALGVATNNNLA